MSFNGIIENIIRKAAVTPEDGDYIQDGLLYCGRCHTRRQTRVRLPGGIRTVGCVCSCREQEHEAMRVAEKQAEQRIRVKNMLDSNPIYDRSLRHCCFETSDDTRTLQKCRDYVAKWPEMKAKNIGCLFYGSPGTGKTHAAACIANALIEQGIPALITSFPRILNVKWDDKQRVIDSLRAYSLLVIDDLGVERNSDFAGETVYEVIDERCKARLPLIITTNLSLDELKNPANIRYQRIYERILEVCVPIAFKERSLRSDKTRDMLNTARDVLAW